MRVRRTGLLVSGAVVAGALAVSGGLALASPSTLARLTRSDAPPPAAQASTRWGDNFRTLPPGSPLPSDATCAAQIRPAAEVRPANRVANHTRGVGGNAEYPRVTGDFVGTTDEIIQWAACKWGIDENIVRAQAAVESWWSQSNPGDFTATTGLCVPGHRTLGAQGVAGECPESIGILQVRYPYHGSAFRNNDALMSTAYNLDYTYAVWRDCYDGDMTWLNSVEHGATYTAGDVWGCVGVWYSGRWYTPAAISYINKVKNYLAGRIWETPDFIHGP